MRHCKLLYLILLCFLVSACAPYLALKQPKEKDVTLFRVGTPRASLIAEFGKPETSELKIGGMKQEIFKFTDGYSKPAIIGRNFGHNIADVLTLGAWENIGTPIEVFNDGDHLAYLVTYDRFDKVSEVVLLKKD